MSRERESKQRLVTVLFWPGLSNLITILDCFCSLQIKRILHELALRMSYISTWEFLRTREKCGEARAEGECLSALLEEQVYFFLL